jgi:hypothetical protein
MKSQCAFNLLRSFFKRVQSPGKVRESPGKAGAAEKDRKSPGTSGQVPAGRAAGTGVPFPGLWRGFPGLCADFARTFLALAAQFVTVCETGPHKVELLLTFQNFYKVDDPVGGVGSASASGVQTAAGFFHADFVVGAGDYHHMEHVLLDAPHRCLSEHQWDQFVMSPSSLLFYVVCVHRSLSLSLSLSHNNTQTHTHTLSLSLSHTHTQGVSKRLHQLRHHNLFFDEDLELHAQEIYTTPKWPSRPLFYVCLQVCVCV